MTAVSPNTVVSAEKVLAALKIGASFNWAGAIAAFEGENTQAKILDGMIAADDVAEIVGVFLPPAAIVANDLGVAIAVEPFVYQIVAWLISQPLPQRIIGQVSIWGQTVKTSVISTITGWFKTAVLPRP